MAADRNGICAYYAAHAPHFSEKGGDEARAEPRVPTLVDFDSSDLL